MSRKIEVTVPIIERACQRDSRHCMVAEAIQADRPRWRNISVDLQTIRWSDPKTRMRYTALTPEPVGRAIVAFDRGESVDPFVFTLSPVHKIRSTIGTQGKRRQGRLFDEARAQRQRQERNPSVKVGAHGVTVEGGRSLPRGHLGGSVTSGEQRPGELAETPEGNVLLSSGRYRQYGLRQLRD